MSVHLVHIRTKIVKILPRTIWITMFFYYLDLRSYRDFFELKNLSKCGKRSSRRPLISWKKISQHLSKNTNVILRHVSNPHKILKIFCLKLSVGTRYICLYLWRYITIIFYLKICIFLIKTITYQFRMLFTLISKNKFELAYLFYFEYKTSTCPNRHKSSKYRLNLNFF